MNKTQKLAITISSGFLVIVFGVLSLVSNANSPKGEIWGKIFSSNSSLCNPATVLSPNGGEFFNNSNFSSPSNPASDLITVTWETCNVPASAIVNIALEFKGDFPAYVFGDTINDGEETYVVPTLWNFPLMESGLYYKVGVTVPRENPNLFYTDFSDNLFTINALGGYDVSGSEVWIKNKDYPGIARDKVVGFGVGLKGYIVTGITYDAMRPIDLWEWDVIQNFWTQKADFPGLGRSNAIGFVIDKKGYVGTGQGLNAELKDFWEYDTFLNKWTQKADFGGGYRFRAVGIGLGNDNYGVEKSDLWSYAHLSDKWIQQNDFNGGPRSDAVMFDVVCPVIGTGSLNAIQFFKDLWSTCQVF